jgi:hypothetical protein
MKLAMILDDYLYLETEDEWFWFGEWVDRKFYASASLGFHELNEETTLFQNWDIASKKELKSVIVNYAKSIK